LMGGVFRRLPDAPQGRLYGVIYAFGAVGSLLVSMVLRTIMSWRAREEKNHFAFRLTMYLPMLLAVVLAATSLLWAVVAPSEGAPPPTEPPAQSESGGRGAPRGAAAGAGAPPPPPPPLPTRGVQASAP